MNLKPALRVHTNRSQSMLISQCGQASFEFLATFTLGILLVSSALLSVWLVSLKLFLQALVFEASATAAHNFSLSFNNKIFFENENIRNDLKEKVSLFPFLNALGLEASRSRFELTYFSSRSNREFTQRDLVEGVVDAKNIAAIQARFYFCLRGLGGNSPFLRLHAQVTSATDRDCLGQIHSSNSGGSAKSSEPKQDQKSNSMRLFFVSAAHSTLHSARILRNGLEKVDMPEERRFLYNSFFKEGKAMKGMPP